VKKQNGLVVAMLAILSMGSVVSANISKPSLKIGDPAPPLKIMSWIKGQPVIRFEPGRVYVVEFWATWCPTCNAAMPHLSALQRKYADQLTVIAVDSRESEYADAGVNVLKKFVEKKGDRMAYTVAMDYPDKSPAYGAWATAAGVDFMSISFVIDRHGEIAWMGVPFSDSGFDAAVDKAVRGITDLPAAQGVQTTMNRETARYADLLKPVHAALRNRNYSGTLVEADKVLAQAPELGPALFTDRLDALLHTHEPKALAFAAIFANQEKKSAKPLKPFTDLHVHNEGEYWSLVAGEIASQSGLSPKTYRFAAEHLRKSIVQEPDNVKNWSRLAAAEARLGHFKQAATAQEKAIKIARDHGVTETVLAELNGTLGQYKTRA